MAATKEVAIALAKTFQLFEERIATMVRETPKESADQYKREKLAITANELAEALAGADAYTLTYHELLVVVCLQYVREHAYHESVLQATESIMAHATRPDETTIQ